MGTVPDIRSASRPLVLVGIAVCGIVLSGFLGGTTNAVNGSISSGYFVTVLGWQGVEDVWRASIAQGIYEGLLFGIFFSLVFTVTTGIITDGACSFGFAFKHLVGVLGGAYGCWILGGLAGLGLASLSPSFYQLTFFGVPQGYSAMLRYAWVGGSIWGAEFGGLFSVIVGLVILRTNWRRQIAVLLSDSERSGRTMNVIEETIEATLDSTGQLRLTHQPRLPPGPVRVTIRVAAAVGLRRGMADVIQEIDADQRLRGFHGRTAAELQAEEEARLAEDDERDREQDAARHRIPPGSL